MHLRNETRLSHDVAPDLDQRFNVVKATFIMRGTSFHAWCISIGVAPQNARAALLGQWSGPKGRALVERILKETDLQEAA